ncbi:uncharacterized protein METZ01_LOCUS514259, partial [marine metagenome]
VKEFHLNSAEVLLGHFEGRTPEYVINLPWRAQLRRKTTVGMDDHIVGKLPPDKSPGHLASR